MKVREAWSAAVHGVAESEMTEWTTIGNFKVLKNCLRMRVQQLIIQNVTVCLFEYLIYLINFWLCYVFVVAWELSPVAVNGLFIVVASLVAEQRFLLYGLQKLWCRGSVALCHMEYSRTRNWNCVPCIGMGTPIHCTTREVPFKYF